HLHELAARELRRAGDRGVVEAADHDAELLAVGARRGDELLLERLARGAALGLDEEVRREAVERAAIGVLARVAVRRLALRRGSAARRPRLQQSVPHALALLPGDAFVVDLVAADERLAAGVLRRRIVDDRDVRRQHALVERAGELAAELLRLLRVQALWHRR